jgi:hypothetical protein
MFSLATGDSSQPVTGWTKLTSLCQRSLCDARYWMNFHASRWCSDALLTAK